MFHKINHNKVVGNYNLTKINNIHNYNTRLAKNINYYQKLNRLNIGLSSFTTNGLKFWKTIPTEYKVLPFHLFKIKIKQHLLELLQEDAL